MRISAPHNRSKFIILKGFLLLFIIFWLKIMFKIIAEAVIIILLFVTRPLGLIISFINTHMQAFVILALETVEQYILFHVVYI